MARPHSWLPRLAEIRRAVENSKRTHYDRPAIQHLFQIQPRAANKLMEMLPRVEALGSSHLVERTALAAFLDTVNEAEDSAAAITQQRAQKRVPSRRRPRMLVRKDLISESHLGSLPSSVKLERGYLRIDFNSRMEFLESMASFLGAVENDFDEFLAKYVEADNAETREHGLEDTRQVKRLFEELRQMEANRDKRMN